MKVTNPVSYCVLKGIFKALISLINRLDFFIAYT